MRGLKRVFTAKACGCSFYPWEPLKEFHHSWQEIQRLNQGGKSLSLAPTLCGATHSNGKCPVTPSPTALRRQSLQDRYRAGEPAHDIAALCITRWSCLIRYRQSRPLLIHFIPWWSFLPNGRYCRRPVFFITRRLWSLQTFSPSRASKGCP